MIKVKIFVFLFFFQFYSGLFAQEMTGISHSNFSGNMGMYFNPSLFVGSPYLSEFNLISGDIFLDNDYVYLKKGTSILSGDYGENRIGDYYPGSPKNMYSSVNFRGPSYIRNDEKISWGIHTGLRSATSATNVPYHLAKFLKEGFDYIPQHNTNFDSDRFRSASMIWGELGGTLGRKLYEERNKSFLSGAATMKFLIGFDGAYSDFSDFSYRVPSADTLIMLNGTGVYAHSLVDGEDGNTMSKPFKFRGLGLGMDIGFTFYRGRVHGSGDCNKSAERLKKYKYRTGISLIDVGFIRFVNQAEVYSFSNASFIWPGINNADLNSVAAFDSAASIYSTGTIDGALNDDRFTLWLPTALSFDFDYCLAPKWYLNASLVQAAPFSKVSVVRSSLFAVTPRYETRRFELSVPFILHEYQEPHLGLAFRYKYFVLGTDRLGAFTGLWDTTGLDLFFGFKFNVCSRGGKSSPYCPAYSSL